MIQSEKIKAVRPRVRLDNRNPWQDKMMFWVCKRNISGKMFLFTHQKRTFLKTVIKKFVNRPYSLNPLFWKFNSNKRVFGTIRVQIRGFTACIHNFMLKFIDYLDLY